MILAPGVTRDVFLPLPHRLSPYRSPSRHLPWCQAFFLYFGEDKVPVGSDGVVVGSDGVVVGSDGVVVHCPGRSSK